MDVIPSFGRGRGRGGGRGHDVHGRGRPHSRNKTWVANSAGSSQDTPGHADGGRWERGGHRAGPGRGIDRPRSFPNASLVVKHPPQVFGGLPNGDEEVYEEHEEEGDYHEEDEGMEEEDEDELHEEIDEPTLESQEEREKFYQELVKAREAERKKAIADGLMDDPLVPKRLEDAITLVGTCMDMAPRFERYRRERENNLFEWETIPGTKRVNHKRAVKMYERAAGDKTLPSDLRPPKVLKKTLDYLFHDLLLRGGFSQTFNFIRDRSRAVRNDFTMQHETGPLAIECHDRCARFHILALHIERTTKGFSVALEEQQLMNTLQSLKEFYEDQRGRYESPTELEMRVYHRLIHIRDQKERHEDIPPHITAHPVFKLTTRFRQHVQTKSAPISKISKLVVDAQAMQIFGELAVVLREQGSVVMIYLVACILERLFGPDTIDDIESIRGGLELPDIIDGVSAQVDDHGDEDLHLQDEVPFSLSKTNGSSSPLKPTATEWLDSNFRSTPAASSVFGATSSAFGTSSTTPPSVFGATPASSNAFASSSKLPVQSAFSNLATTPNAFSSTSTFGVQPPKSIFGATASNSPSNPFAAPPPPNTFGLPAGGPSPFGGIVSSTSAPDAVGTVPSAVPAPSNGFFPSTSVPSFGHGSLFGPSITSNGFNNELVQSKSPVNTPFASRPPPQMSLNPVAPAFTPTFKPTPSPLRQDNTDAIPGVPNGASSIPPSVPPTSNLTPSFTWPMLPNTNKAVGSLFHESQPFANTPRLTTAPPALPRINTTSSAPSQVLDIVQSPLPHPPPLNYNSTVSLPSTPTTSTPAALYPSPGGVSPAKSKSLLNILKGSLHTGVSASSEILSPLALSSPSTSRAVHNFANGGPSSASPLSLSARKLSLGTLPTSLGGRRPSINGKGKEPEIEIDLVARAAEFAGKGVLVKERFERWHTRLTEKKAWAEACRRSDAYSQKIQRERMSESPSDRKRRLVSGVALETPQRKRARKRVSSEYRKPRTDEELARRFKANHEEHERRWAHGSFGQEVRSHVKCIANGSPHGWQIWLSMNPEVDATAIWLERKFDVPASGQWGPENIFSIPVGPTENSQASPGVIVFERTPLEGVTDEIERKYRVLDDCSRLRDLIDALPSSRHYVPCLLTITWIDPAHGGMTSDFSGMVEKLVRDNILAGHYNFAMTSETMDLDHKLKEGLGALPLDVEGRLVEALSISGVFKMFAHTWKELSSEWLSACSTSGDLDWYLYGQVVETSVNLLNAMAKTTLGLVGALQSVTLPPLSTGELSDSDTMYDVVLAWLNTETFRDIGSNMPRELQSQRSMARDFPSGPFVEHLYDLAMHILEIKIGRDTKKTFYVLKTDIAAAVHTVEDTAKSHAASLTRVFTLSAHRSPKRRPSVGESVISSTPSKRRRLSLSNPSSPSDDDGSQTSSAPYDSRKSPSPTISASTAPLDSESPAITVAMLRALTRDIKSKYGGSPLAKG